MHRTLYCQYEQKVTEGLNSPPFPGEIGEEIYQKIGKDAWAKWLAYQTILINENRLSMRTPEHRTFLLRAMQAYLFEKKELPYLPQA